MKPRLEYAKIAPGAYHAMLQLHRYEGRSELDPKLLELVKIRVSQINACAFCLDMHWKDALALGENEQRLYELNAWRETPFYSEKERAALAWTEALTLVSETHVPDDVYEEVGRHFSEKELVDITMSIVEINGWNRLAVGFRTLPGTYQPADKKAQHV